MASKPLLKYGGVFLYVMDARFFKEKPI